MRKMIFLSLAKQAGVTLLWGLILRHNNKKKDRIKKVKINSEGYLKTKNSFFRELVN